VFVAPVSGVLPVSLDVRLDARVLIFATVLSGCTAVLCGASESDILDAYPHLTVEDIRAALAYAADTVSHETILFTGAAGGAVGAS
jgi:hypothetical protein